MPTSATDAGAWPPGHDVFFSYNWRDHASVEAVARALEERGVSVFLDRWYLTPGRSWQDILEENTSTARAVAVFVGPEGLGRWQQREKELALDRQTREEEFGVIPVLLPGAEPALGFLGLSTWVDLRSGIDDAVQLEILARAVQGEPPGTDVRDRVAGAVCPYRGLQPFREEDAAFFFGREAFTELLVAKVDRSRFVAVVGASGSGKSSVVRAGLLPWLRRRTEDAWEIVKLVPGDRPLHALAAALLPLLEPDLREVDRLAEINKTAGYLAEGSVSLRDLVEGALTKQPGTDRLLVFVDQWEELYALCEDEKARRRFVDELLEASERGPLTVVMTMRGDFYGEALGHRGLGWRMQDSTVNLGPMRREDLELVVESPAARVGLRFQDGLIDRILDAVGDEPGNLPLLEFVLADLWKARRGDLLHHDAYDAMGELEGAMANRAEAVYAALTQKQQELARRVVRRLVRLGEGSEATRQRVRLSTMDAGSREVVKKLAHDRLLVTGLDQASQEETLEVAHEALIRHWDRLRRWIAEDRELLLWTQRLRTFVQEWERDPGAVLRGRGLEEAERWVGARADAIDDDERALVAASVAARDRERRNRWVATTAVVLAVTGVAWVAVFWQRIGEDRAEFERLALGTSLPRGWVDSLPDLFGDSLGEAERHRRFAEAYYGLEDLAARGRATPRRALELRDEVRASFLGRDSLLPSPPTPEADARLNERIPIGGGVLTRAIGEDSVRVRISAFRLQEHEVTNEEYARFDPSRSVQGSPRARLPVGDVNWYDAMAYAAWLGGTLPTEAQWEFAARGEEGRQYPWGDQEPRCDLAIYAGCGAVDTVMSRPAGATPDNGVYDLAGNVWEWVSGWYDEYDPADEEDPRGSPMGALRVLRGGSFDDDASYLPGADRVGIVPGNVDVGGGFRVAWPGGQD